MESSFSAGEVDELDKVIEQCSAFEAEHLNSAGKLLESLGWNADTMRLAHYAGTGKRAIQLHNEGDIWINVFETNMKMPEFGSDDFTIKMTAQWVTPPPNRTGD